MCPVTVLLGTFPKSATATRASSREPGTSPSEEAELTGTSCRREPSDSQSSRNLKALSAVSQRVIQADEGRERRGQAVVCQRGGHVGRGARRVGDAPFHARRD